MGADTWMRVDTQRGSCELVPCCKHGDHGTHAPDGGQHAAKPIGKYYFTEDALKHDLAALKRGEVYERDDFYRRAKAWYKAEIDRLLHLEKVKEEAYKLSTNDDLIPGLTYLTRPPEPLPAIPAEQPAKQPAPKPPPPPRRTPTRIQPFRAAKQKAAAKLASLDSEPEESPTSTTASGRRPTAPSKSPLPAQPPLLAPVRSVRPGETRGDYALVAGDWARFREHTAGRGEHAASPWSYVRLQGLDVAYFVMRLERVVREKVVELQQQQRKRSDEEENKGGARHDGTAADKTTSICTLHGGKGQNEKRPLFAPAAAAAPFEPAGALAPGEDWRPPGWHADGGGGDEAGKGGREHGVMANGGAGSCWAAAEVGRREKEEQEQGRRRTRETTPAPEAEMEFSPTLGRWPSTSNKGEVMGEELAGRVVNVSGLRFAVVICSCPGARVVSEVEGEEGAWFWML